MHGSVRDILKAIGERDLRNNRMKIRAVSSLFPNHLCRPAIPREKDRALVVTQDIAHRIDVVVYRISGESNVRDRKFIVFVDT